MVKVIASSLRKGNVVEIDGRLYAVLSATNFHPGKGTPTTQIDMRRLSDGTKVSNRYKTTEQVERAFVEDHDFSYLYEDGDGYTFTDFASTLASNRDDDLLDLTIQPDGKILAVGRSESTVSAHQVISIARYNPNGSLDLTFGGGDGVGPFQPMPARRALGLGHALVADEDQFRGEIHPPHGQAAVPARQRRGAHADLAAAGAGQQRQTVDGAAVRRVGAARRAARIVAVKAMAPVGVELAFAEQPERPQHEAQLGAGLAGAGLAAVAHIEGAAGGGDVGLDLVAAQADGAAQPRQPVGTSLDEQTGGGFGDAVLADGVGAPTILGGVEADRADAVLP